MKYAIISDVHANREALQAVLQDAAREKCIQTACLGDVVGYGGSPKECVDLIRAMKIPCVKGNQDEFCGNGAMIEDLTNRAATSLRRSRDLLTEDDRRWLRELPLKLVVDGFTIVHANLDEPSRWGYVFNEAAALESFAHLDTAVGFFGHTHVPMAFVQENVVRGGTYTKLQIDAGRKYFINAGSVGQPRDGNPKAAYVIYDLDNQSVELRRLDYDVAAAQKKIRDAGLL